MKGVIVCWASMLAAILQRGVAPEIVGSTLAIVGARRKFGGLAKVK
jgi:hypothetical protein